MNSIILAGQIVSEIKTIFKNDKTGKILYSFVIQNHDAFIEVKAWGNKLPKNVTLRVGNYVEVAGKLEGGDSQGSSSNSLLASKVILISKYDSEIKD